MKKFIFTALSIGALALFNNFAYANSEIVESPQTSIFIEGNAGNYTNYPIIHNDRTLLPLREMLINLGVTNDDAHIKWNERDKSVTILKDKKVIYLRVGSKEAKVNEEIVNLDAEPVNYKNRVFIPVRFVAQSLDKKVEWDPSTKTVYLGEKPAIKEVTVSNVTEFVKEIGSNKKIILKPGSYDITTARSPYVSGGELCLQNIKNLTILGAGMDKTEIKTEPRNAHIMYFKNSSNINILGIKAGHVPAEYKCDAGVLKFEDSQKIYINGCELYGCGSVGISTRNVTGLVCANTIIDHCSLLAVYINSSDGIVFKNTRIENHEAYSNIINLYASKDVVFDKCTISDNNKFTWAFAEISQSVVEFKECKISNNTLNTSDPRRTRPVNFIKTTGYSNNSASRVKFINTEISNNICDTFVDKKENVVFENCDIRDNNWTYEYGN